MKIRPASFQGEPGGFFSVLYRNFSIFIRLKIREQRKEGGGKGERDLGTLAVSRKGGFKKRRRKRKGIILKNFFKCVDRRINML